MDLLFIIIRIHSGNQNIFFRLQRIVFLWGKTKYLFFEMSKEDILTKTLNVGKK